MREVKLIENIDMPMVSWLERPRSTSALSSVVTLKIKYQDKARGIAIVEI